MVWGKERGMLPKDFSWRVLLFGMCCSLFLAIATTYVTLKMGMSADLSVGAMLLASMIFGKKFVPSQMKIQLNIIQTMVGAASGVGFMCVILAAFYYLRLPVEQGGFGRTDVVFNPSGWQMFLWITLSAYLGSFMGALPRKSLLDDPSLPWPAAKATSVTIEALVPDNHEQAQKKKSYVFFGMTSISALVTLLRDLWNVMPSFVGKESLYMKLEPQLMPFGLGLLLPLRVGLSTLAGVFIFVQFGDYVAKLTALRDIPAEHFAVCSAALSEGNAEVVQSVCQTAAAYLKPSHFKLAVQWFMWPATAAMIAAAMTSVLLNLFRKKTVGTKTTEVVQSEEIPKKYVYGGIVICASGLVFFMNSVFGMHVAEVCLAIGIQLPLIVAGGRVMATIGQGPVSVMANATQLLFAWIFPGSIAMNMQAAHISADPQASSETTLNSFYIARLLGGSERMLIIAQLLAIPVAAMGLYFGFDLMVQQYGFGGEGLSAPTGLKFASLAVVLEKGVSALPPYALSASLIAIVVGVVFEVLASVRKNVGSTDEITRFPWIPSVTAICFALILPPFLSLPIALGSICGAIWKKMNEEKYHANNDSVAAGFIAGDAIVAGIFIPLVLALLQYVMTLLP